MHPTSKRCRLYHGVLHKSLSCAWGLNTYSRSSGDCGTVNLVNKELPNQQYYFCCPTLRQSDAIDSDWNSTQLNLTLQQLLEPAMGSRHTHRKAISTMIQINRWQKPDTKWHKKTSVEQNVNRPLTHSYLYTKSSNYIYLERWEANIITYPNRLRRNENPLVAKVEFERGLSVSMKNIPSRDTRIKEFRRGDGEDD